jgi:hypothetical protein
MNMRVASRLWLAIAMVSVVSCSKDATAPTPSAVSADFLVSGKGLRRFYATEFPNAGGGQHYVSDVTLSTDGYVHAIYAYGTGGVNGVPGTFTNFRTKVSVANGDTVAAAIPAPLRNANLGNATIGCAGFGLVPYTDVIVYANAGVIDGTPNWQSTADPGGISKVYAGRNAACSSTYFNVLDTLMHVAARFTMNGALQPQGDKVLTPRTLTASVELSPAGVPLTFVMDKYDTLSVLNYSTGARLASVSLPMILRYIPANFPANYRPDVYMVTKVNRAGTSVSGIVNNVQGKVFSTFVYDIASSRLTVRNQNVTWNTPLYLSGLETFDDDGNVYYVSRNNTTVINRVTPAGGDQVYRTGFTSAGGVGFLKHVDNKLIVVLTAPGDTRFSDSRGRGRMYITVAE